MKRLATGILSTLALGICSGARGDMLGALPAGIAYPFFPTAAYVNPAGLPLEWGTAFEGLYNPPLSRDDAHNYMASIATANTHRGLNAGLLGSTYQKTTLQSGFAGGGYRFNQFSAGLALHTAGTDAAFAPGLDAGTLLRLGPRVRLALVGYSLNHLAQTTVGLGYGKDHAYNLELDVTVPRIFAGVRWGREYTATAVAALYRGRFGLSGGASYARSFENGSAQSRVSYNLAGSCRLGKNFTFLGQYGSSPQTVGIGLIVGYYPDTTQRYESHQREKLNGVAH